MRTPKQLEFKKVKGWGGRRKGAGRKNKTGEAGHTKRERVDFKKPLHITLKIKRSRLRLRADNIQQLFKTAIKHAQRFEFLVLHYSLQEDHVHMLVEAKNNQALARGLRSLGCRFAKGLRQIVGGKGSVFKGRAHVHVLKTPTEMKRALRYVLLNTSKHLNLLEHVDRYSSSMYFRRWRQLLGRKVGALADWDERERGPVRLPEFLSPPRSWLARTGWEKGAS